MTTKPTVTRYAIYVPSQGYLADVAYKHEYSEHAEHAYSYGVRDNAEAVARSYFHHNGVETKIAVLTISIESALDDRMPDLTYYKTELELLAKLKAQFDKDADAMTEANYRKYIDIRWLLKTPVYEEWLATQ